MTDSDDAIQSSSASAESSGAVEPETGTSFEQAASEEQPGIVAEFLEFLIESKAWWITPIVVVLLLVGLLIVLSSSVVAPFIYPIF